MQDGATYTTGLDWVLPSDIDLRDVRFYDVTAGSTVEMGDYFKYGYQGNTALGMTGSVGHGHIASGTTGAHLMNEWTNRYTIHYYRGTEVTGGVAETTYGTGLSSGSELQREFTNRVYDGYGDYAGYGSDNVGSSASGWTSGVTLSSGSMHQNFKTNWWHIYSHPNIRGINNIPKGMTWGAIRLRDFFWMTKDHGPGYEDDPFTDIDFYDFDHWLREDTGFGQEG